MVIGRIVLCYFVNKLWITFLYWVNILVLLVVVGKFVTYERCFVVLTPFLKTNNILIHTSTGITTTTAEIIDLYIRNKQVNHV